MAPQTFHMGGLLQEMREIEEQEMKYVPQRGKGWEGGRGDREDIEPQWPLKHSTWEAYFRKWER